MASEKQREFSCSEIGGYGNYKILILLFTTILQTMSVIPQLEGEEIILNIFENIDIKQTRKNVRRLSKRYRNLERLVGPVKIDFSVMTVTKNLKSTIDSQNEEFVEAISTRDSVIDALTRLSKIHFQVLYYSYCFPNKMTMYQIGEKLGYSDRTIERMKAVALVEFAEAYKSGELISLTK
ncbi:ArpU family phage packaging/lysis transcriptional regulator [Enterococcus faecium]|uniref:ArpU family phage packaging/lysis transcriptional regulator n=1 Tax=Enterococcus faecium TaxID=1352 RepID=UPI001D0E0425|nr:ArpU family phage packaging/lysis transcriptional regulator [Enterococcus faecium]